MRNTNSGFSIVDLLTIIALFLIVLGLFGPRVANYMNKSKPNSSPAAAVHPVR